MRYSGSSPHQLLICLLLLHHNPYISGALSNECPEQEVNATLGTRDGCSVTIEHCNTLVECQVTFPNFLSSVMLIMQR